MTLPKFVKIVEVAPRDGLQNEPQTTPTAIKLEFINKLSDTGLRVIETTSFVSPKRIPQLADHSVLMQQLIKKPGVIYSVLVPNLHGFTQAWVNRAQEISIFTAASNTFTQKNINCSIAESFSRFKPIMQAAKRHKIPVRGYISCALGCPYEGLIDPTKVVAIAKRLYDLGCYEISIGDTLGVGTAHQCYALFKQLTDIMPTYSLAAHFHNTYGQALANLYAVLQLGVAVIDSSVSGLGGCPYAKGASGNVATEDVLYMLQGLGIETGVDMQKLLAAGTFITNFLQRKPDSKVAQVLLSSYTQTN